MYLSVVYRQKQTEVTRLEEQIRVKAEEQRRAGQSLDSTCQICLKTKFADGVGHLCNYCNVRCCARCGGKVALRSSKVSVFYTRILAFLLHTCSLPNHNVQNAIDIFEFTMQ